MNHKNAKTQPSLTIEYDYFIDDVKAELTYLYIDLVNAVFKQGGNLSFIISYCNHPIPDEKISPKNQDDFSAWLNHIQAIHR